MVELYFFWLLNAYLKVFVLEEVMFVELRIGLYDFRGVVNWVHGRAEKKRFERVGAAFSSARTKAEGDCMIELAQNEKLAASNVLCMKTAWVVHLVQPPIDDEWNRSPGPLSLPSGR